MTDHATSAVLAGGRQTMNRTFEAVVGGGGAVEPDLHRLRVFASSDCAACHGVSPSAVVGIMGSGAPFVMARLQRLCPEEFAMTEGPVAASLHKAVVGR